MEGVCWARHDPFLCLQGAAPGALDGYLDTILPVMDADLFGDIAEAKEADAFAAKYRCVTSALLMHWTVTFCSNLVCPIWQLKSDTSV